MLFFSPGFLLVRLLLVFGKAVVGEVFVVFVVFVIVVVVSCCCCRTKKRRVCYKCVKALPGRVARKKSGISKKYLACFVVRIG